MDAALMLGQGEPGGVPGVGAQARGVVDGEAKVVAEFGAGAALGRVFVAHGHPLAVEKHLRGSRYGWQRGQQGQYDE